MSEILTQEEIARKCSAAPAVCGFGKCPFLDLCKYDRKKCVMQHIAMMLRTNLAELNNKDRQISLMRDIANVLLSYSKDLEYANRQYHDAYMEYQAGYKPGQKKKAPRRKVTRKNAAKFDGNPLYADESGFDSDPKDVII